MLTVCCRLSKKVIHSIKKMLFTFSLSNYKIPIDILVIYISNDNSLTSLTYVFYIFKEYCIITTI